MQQTPPVSEAQVPEGDHWTVRLSLGLAFVLVVLGMANNLPSIPGLLELVRAVPGLEGIPRLSKYSSEYFFPLMFVLMMATALLLASFGRDWSGRSPVRQACGVAVDLLMLAAILGMAVVYLIEHEQVCLIDQVTGERARLMAETAARAEEYRAIFGIDPVEEYPDCQSNLGNWILPFLLAALAVFFVYIVKAWGFPIVAVAIVVALYTVVSSAAWYFEWSDHRYLTTSIGTESDGIRNYAAGVIGARNAIIQESNSILGRFLSVIVNIVFPYVVLGALFGASAGGQSLIKLAFRVTRGLARRAGPCRHRRLGDLRHGVRRPRGQRARHRNPDHPDDDAVRLLADLRRRRRGGRVERRPDHAPGHGHRGLRAGRLVDGALIRRSSSRRSCRLSPISFSLFLTVVFEARRTGMPAMASDSGEHAMTGTDWTNLSMIAGPIVVIPGPPAEHQGRDRHRGAGLSRRLRPGLGRGYALAPPGGQERGRRSGFGGFSGPSRC